MTSQNDGLLKIAGIDAKKLLQGQLTCNVDDVTTGNSCLGAHCNPQGRVISLFRLCLIKDAYYLYMPRALVPIALNALKKYAVFYKVELSDASEDLAAILSTAQLAPYVDIPHGVPAIFPETSGKFLPHDINLPDLQVVNFDKGCFTGQEIIARMQYRGKPKKHLYRAEIISPEPPQPGTDIFSNHLHEKQRAGTVVNAALIKNDLYDVLLVTEEAHAINNHLFLSGDQDHFFHFTMKATGT